MRDSLPEHEGRPTLDSDTIVIRVGIAVPVELVAYLGVATFRDASPDVAF